MADGATGQGDNPLPAGQAAASRPWPAGLIVCENRQCDHLITEVQRDKRGRLFLELAGVKLYARGPLSLVCPKCGRWRNWNPRKYHRGRRLVDTPPD